MLSIRRGICTIRNPSFRPVKLKLQLFGRNKRFSFEVSPYRRRYCVVSKSARSVQLFKLNSPEFYSIFTPELKKLDAIFKNHGHELRVVGGAVRDLLMGLKPADLDLSTTANPQQMKLIFSIENIRIVNNKGEKHGTIFVRIDDRTNFEITSLRTDLVCDGRHAKVEFISDWGQDASRRDLTINALYLGLDGTVYDYVGGYEDLKNRRVLFVGDPEKRIEEDFLRILRYFRFFGRISNDPCKHDEKTLEVIRTKVNGLDRISGERIWFELSRILLGNFKKEVITTMLKLNLGPSLGLDEIGKLDMDCFSTICNVDHKYSFKAITFIAALLLTEEQVTKFYERAKLPSYDRDLAFFLVYHKSDDIFVNIENRFKSLQYLIACTNISKTFMHEYIIELLKFQRDDELLKKFQSWTLPPFPITHSQIVKITKIKNPRSNSAVRRKLMENWILNDFQLSENELLDLIPNIVKTIQTKEQIKD